MNAVYILVENCFTKLGNMKGMGLSRKVYLKFLDLIATFTTVDREELRKIMREESIEKN